jgi:hypothetical protein
MSTAEIVTWTAILVWAIGIEYRLWVMARNHNWLLAQFTLLVEAVAYRLGGNHDNGRIHRDDRGS